MGVEVLLFQQATLRSFSAPAIFQKFTTAIVENLTDRLTMLTLDDFLIMGRSIKECKRRTRELTKLLLETGIMINNSKSILKPQKKIEFLGVTVTGKNFDISKEKRDLALKAIDLYPQASMEQKAKILGYLNFY